MKPNGIISWIGVVVLVTILIAGCSQDGYHYHPILGFDVTANEQLEQFLIDTRDEPGRKIAVFDGDGTVLGQAPHYLADECLYMYANEHPGYKQQLIDKMVTQSNVSIPYVQNRVHYFASMSLQQCRDLGEQCFQQYYAGKMFRPIQDLIRLLKQNSFEIWVVTASPEAMYQQFLSRELDIPITNIIGIRSVISNGEITDEIVHPIPQDHGKKEAIETFVQDRPLLVAGNSRGDKEMIEYSRGLHMIVNPDERVAPDQVQSMAEYANENHWLVVRIADQPPANFPSVTSRDYHVRENRVVDVSTQATSWGAVPQRRIREAM